MKRFLCGEGPFRILSVTVEWFPLRKSFQIPADGGVPFQYFSLRISLFPYTPACRTKDAGLGIVRWRPRATKDAGLGIVRRRPIPARSPRFDMRSEPEPTFPSRLQERFALLTGEDRSIAASTHVADEQPRRSRSWDSGRGVWK